MVTVIGNIWPLVILILKIKTLVGSYKYLIKYFSAQMGGKTVIKLK